MATAVSSPSLTPEQIRRRTLYSGTIGAIVEWYEYTVYATAAALVFGKLFFPAMAPGISQIAALATFGVGFVARPLGAFVAGHLGDRIGRKATLILTFSIMTVATAAIGLLPTYGQVGMLAPILLCVLRLAQGFAVGGEWGGAAIIAVENAPEGKRGFYGSWPQIGVSCGLLLGTAAVSAAAALSGDGFETWGWRLPFLLAVVLAAVGLYIRLNATESPEFLAEQERLAHSGEESRAPLKVLFKEHRRPLLIAIFGRFAEAGNYYLFTVFVLSYATTTLGVPRQYGLAAVMIGSALNIVMIPVFGRLSDTIGRKKTFLLGGAAIILTAWPTFALVYTGQQWAIILGVSLFLALGHAMVYAPLPAMYCELFPTSVRYSGISVGYQMASILLAGFMPALAGAIVLWTGGTGTVVAIIILSTAIAMISISFAPETKDVDLATVGQPAAR
ncbi:MHS family MFS transporter [Micrococcus luteus]|uniref:MFS transporter n=1 Tax=Micrococcus luteus TaxID=1270 RepID=UPI001408BE57|nr:MFS transporter [Micrococcus luteus]MCV7450481.1 MHS family MFS transporter [Micrococcus luteus]MCV7481639.1 MHS family MFS transporter [Micrococcus luteus]MCV7630416.1 MHS family MFS transporter [Micrococcus luteus]MCV7663726.1 MHS family MFS transporter [Micrococcus luteus]MCV7737556.1 MHS family MFS transporter [Micrococcus luteus]